MPNFTRRAIKESFLKLLNQRPLNQITVKDIVEDCGINRNSFYYHFEDLPALLEEQLPGLTPIACANLPYNITSPALAASILAFSASIPVLLAMLVMVSIMVFI